jgi:hypothetical protein
MNNFETFLQDKHSEDYRGFDDDMPDAYDEWLCNLDGEEYIMYAQMWMSQTMHELTKRTNA